MLHKRPQILSPLIIICCSSCLCFHVCMHRHYRQNYCKQKKYHRSLLGTHNFPTVLYLKWTSYNFGIINNAMESPLLECLNAGTGQSYDGAGVPCFRAAGALTVSEVSRARGQAVLWWLRCSVTVCLEEVKVRSIQKNTGIHWSSSKSSSIFWAASW
jgi:hypothetical protein